MQGIKNIIFDLGGVILNIDYKRPQEEFKKLGIKETFCRNIRSVGHQASSSRSKNRNDYYKGKDSS